MVSWKINGFQMSDINNDFDFLALGYEKKKPLAYCKYLAFG